MNLSTGSTQLHLSPKLTAKLNVLLIALGVLTLLPLLILLAYNYPGADDFGLADRDRSLNFWASQKLFYTEWSGRYFATGILRINPMIWNSVLGYQLLTGVLLLMYLGGLSWLGHALFARSLTLLQVGAVVTLFFCLYISQVSDLTQIAFWISGSLTYLLPITLFLVLLVLVASIFKSRSNTQRIAYTFVAAILSLMIVGSNEMALLMTLSVFLLLGVAAWQHSKEHVPFITIIFVAALVGALVVVLAPGNFVRMDTHARHSEFKWSVMYTTYLTVFFFIRWGSMLLVASVLYVVLWGRAVAEKSAGAALLKVDARFSILLYLATLFVMEFLFTWATSDKAAERVENVIYFYFLFGWFFNLQLLVVQYPRVFNKHIFSPPISVVAFVVLVIFHFKIDGNVTTAYLDLLSGKAATYGKEMEARFRYLNTSDCKVCKVPPLTAIPQTIFFKDLAPHSSHQDYWVNVGYAAYWRKKEVNLIRQNPKAEENTVTLRKLLQ